MPIVRDQILLAFASLNASCDNIKTHKIWSKGLRALLQLRDFSPLIKTSYHFAWPALQDYFVPLGRDDPCSAGEEADVEVARETGMFDALRLI